MLLFPASFRIMHYVDEGGRQVMRGRRWHRPPWEAECQPRGEGPWQLQQHFPLGASVAISLCAFLFPGLVGSPVYSPPQGRAVSTSAGALTMPGKVGAALELRDLILSFEKVTVSLKSTQFHMRNCKRSEIYALKY